MINLDELTQSISDALAQELSPSKQMFDQLVNFFVDDNWSFTRLQGKPVLYTAIQGTHGEWNCYAQIREEQAQFVFYSICPIDVPEDKRMAIAEFLTRANFGIILGNFELDFDDGEIRYKTSIDVTDDFLSQSLIKPLIYANVTMMDEYLPGIQSILNSETTPAEAIQAIAQNTVSTTDSDPPDPEPESVAAEEFTPPSPTEPISV